MNLSKQAYNMLKNCLNFLQQTYHEETISKFHNSQLQRCMIMN